MKKKLAWWLWLPLSAVSPLALAVGLGQATVNSPLQSPLDATVPLVDAAGVIRYRHVGVVDDRVWRDTLEPIWREVLAMGQQP